MSSAFRNFILTLILMLAVLSYGAWKLIPKLEETVLNPIFNDNESSTDESLSDTSADAGDTSESGNDTSDVITPTEDTEFDCLIIVKNKSNHVVSVLYTYASEEKGNYVICSLPVDMKLENSGRKSPLYDLIGSQSNEYALKKLYALVGHDVDNYIIANADTLTGIIGLKKDVVVDVPYDIKYLNPEFVSIPPEDRNESHYITVTAGKVTLDEANASALFTYQSNPDEVNYSLQQSLVLSMFKQIIGDEKFITELALQKRLYSTFSTNMSVNDFSKLSTIIFSYTTSSQKSFTYPTSRDYTENVIVPNWSSGIASINSACDRKE